MRCTKERAIVARLRRFDPAINPEQVRAVIDGRPEDEVRRALGMVARSIRYALATPERRGVLIPIVFHFVLAAFLFAYGSWTLTRGMRPL